MKQDIWQRFNVTKTILKTLEQAASTQDSRFTIKTFIERLALNKTATDLRKVDLSLHSYLDNQNGPNETTQELVISMSLHKTFHFATNASLNKIMIAKRMPKGS